MTVALSIAYTTYNNVIFYSLLQILWQEYPIHNKLPIERSPIVRCCMYICWNCDVIIRGIFSSDGRQSLLGNVSLIEVSSVGCIFEKTHSFLCSVCVWEREGGGGNIDKENLFGSFFPYFRVCLLDVLGGGDAGAADSLLPVPVWSCVWWCHCLWGTPDQSVWPNTSGAGVDWPPVPLHLVTS